MFSRRRTPTMVTQNLLWILLGLLLRPEPVTASLPLFMDSVIQALAAFEQKASVTEAGHSAPVWLLSAGDSGGPHESLYRFLLDRWSLKGKELGPPALSPELRGLTKEVSRHGVQDGREYGVVLAPDGSTVAVEPLMAGLEAGLQGHRVVDLTLASTATPSHASSIRLRRASPDVTSAGAGLGSPHVHTSSPDTKAKPPTTVDGLLVVALARDLGLTFLQGPQAQSHPYLGIDGCWDQLFAPRNFMLLDSNASSLTTAFLNGALDGVILGDYLSGAPEPRPLLSHLLREYYGAGVAGDPELRSNFRRQNGASLTSAATLAPQVWGTLMLLQKLEPGHPQLQGMSQEELARVATHATKEFTEAFLGCPAIHPRCRWGAAPYQGSPTPLKLPLGFLYVHHTYVPAPPCTEFARCAANMRAMQRYHQKTQDWADIGYSFVVGSDGYVYEGRGWRWVGAHTRGHNSRGFGVALVGNYTAELPAEHALRTVREVLPRCAVRAGFLRADYSLLGHRQLVRTDCPGDALFALLHTWPHFDSTVKPRNARSTIRRPKREPPKILPAKHPK